MANSAERNRRQALRTTQLEKRLSEPLGETVWQQTGLGASSALDALQRQISHLEQQVVDLGRQLADRTDELEAARATSRELMAQLNRRAPS